MGVPIHSFDDGWRIEYIADETDLADEDAAVHSGYSCLGYDAELWIDRMAKGDYLLFSLINSDEERRATLLFGKKETIEKNKAGDYWDREYYHLYADCEAFDNKPRVVDGHNLYPLQCCPPGYTAGDIMESAPETKRVRKWWDNLALAQKGGLVSLEVGFNIKPIGLDKESLLYQNDTCHAGQACLTRNSVYWNRWHNEGTCFLYGLYDEEDYPLATIVLGESQYTIEARSSVEWIFGYWHEKTFDQRPRMFDGRSVLLLECVPKGRTLWSDHGAVEIPSQIVKAWYEGLELDENLLDYDVNLGRTEIQKYVKVKFKTLK